MSPVYTSSERERLLISLLPVPPPALQLAIKPDDFTGIGRSVRSETGPLREMKMTAHRMESNADSQSLFLDFTVAGEQGTKACQIAFQFAGLQGQLVGFNFRNP